MKRILLSVFLIAAMGLGSIAHAQCTVSNTRVKLNSSTPVSGGCEINFDIMFDMQQNNGNKYIWLHLWMVSDYPALTYNFSPTEADLVNTVANIGINNDNVPPVLMTSYKGTGVTVHSDGTILKKDNGDGTNTFEITNITITVPGACSNIITLKGDVWSSQAASQSAVHCYSTGLSFVPNDPVVGGNLICTMPRTYNVNITTNSVSTISGTYNIYRDNGDGVFDAGPDVLIISSEPYSASNSSPYNSGVQTYPGNVDPPHVNRSLWVEVTTTGLSNTTYALLENNCAPLPVKYKSFTVTRNRQYVDVRWETAAEQNSNGFYVQRNTNGEWKNVAFVFSQADGGNSEQVLSYKFNDLNPFTGVSQYRIQQVDIDGSFSYSEIRYVKGEAQESQLVLYPNPSISGSVNLVFGSDASARDIIVVDATGRMVRSFRNIRTNSLMIENLNDGFYTIQVTDNTTGTVSSEKLIVNKR